MIKKHIRTTILRHFLLALIIGILFSLARSEGLFHSVRLGSTDFLHGDTSPGNEIVIIAIDDASIAEYGSWPWPHTIHTQLIEKLDQARVVGLDIFFDETGDPALIDAVEQSDNVILAQIGILTEKASPGIISAQAMLTSPSDLRSAAVGEGIVNAIPDSDGVIRRVPLLIEHDGKTEEAMSLQLLRNYLGLTNSSAAVFEEDLIHVDSLRIPVDQWSRMTIHFTGPPGTIDFVSCADVLSGAVPPDAFTDKIVLVGQMNLTGGADVHDVPTSRGKAKISGVELQANIIHTMLHHRFFREQTLASDITLIIIMSLLGSLVPFLVRFWRGGILSVVLVEGGFLLYVFAVFDRGILPDLFYPSLSLGVSYITAIASDNISLVWNLKQKHTELIKTYDVTLQGWARALELRDYETQGHTMRVTNLTVELAKLFGFDKVELAHIRHGAILHDIGKIGIPDSILLKPDKLTDEEWIIMRRHPQYGYEMLFPIQFLKPSLDIVICHHEKWDGSGYPENLKGNNIPLAARIFAVVDVWDALTSDRPYRKALPKERVLGMIQQDSGTHFDPQVVDVFMKYIRNHM